MTILSPKELAKAIWDGVPATDTAWAECIAFRIATRDRAIIDSLHEFPIAQDHLRRKVLGQCE